MKRSVSNYLIFCFILSSSFVCGIDACWGEVAPGYGVMSEDYDLLVGLDLVLNCTLNKLSFPKKLPRNINSSDLVIEKGFQEFDNFTNILDDHTIQLRIPNATVNDSGVYICKIFFSKEIKLVVCPSIVNVAYPPFPVQNFSCISRNFENLYCNWSTERNYVFTTYTIVKMYRNIAGLPQKCPDSTKKPNSCEWSIRTDPTYEQTTRNLSFAIVGKNSLGKITQNFRIDGYSIVIPNSPENLEILHIGQQSATIKWKPPKMRNLFKIYLPLKYQIRITKALYDSSDFMVYDLEDNTTQFTIENLIPYVAYNVSVRCQSVYARKSDMWSVFTSLTFETLSDAPSDPPQNIHVSSNSTDAFFVSWTPPLEPNGIITEYVVSYNGSIKRVDVASQKSKYDVKIDRLETFSTYVVQIQACVNHDCSNKSEPIMIRTEVDEPGYMEPPHIEEVNTYRDHFKVSWTKPLWPNGPIDFYVIKWHRDKQNATIMDNKLEVKSGANSVVLNVKCPFFREENIKYLIYVQAVNKKEGTNLYGPFSKSTQAKACSIPEGLGMFIVIAVGAAVGIFLIIIYKFSKWMKHDFKNVNGTIVLHKAIEETVISPFDENESSKNGNESVPLNNNEKLSYTMDESKNRRGSGSSASLLLK